LCFLPTQLSERLSEADRQLAHSAAAHAALQDEFAQQARARRSASRALAPPAARSRLCVC
jgi:hypothetical protein